MSTLLNRLAVFGLVGAIVQGGMIRPTVKRLGEKATAIMGLIILAAGLAMTLRAVPKVS